MRKRLIFKNIPQRQRKEIQDQRKNTIGKEMKEKSQNIDYEMRKLMRKLSGHTKQRRGNKEKIVKH